VLAQSSPLLEMDQGRCPSGAQILTCSWECRGRRPARCGRHGRYSVHTCSWMCWCAAWCERGVQYDCLHGSATHMCWSKVSNGTKIGEKMQDGGQCVQDAAVLFKPGMAALHQDSTGGLW